ncbi:hypothetical protein ABIB62_003555 [Mucilaginibacter sp. UYP25]|uniref:hypothetical protein n=1 Tax=unclassified Mucilaginibacter TaxID=2617802 RepID=UPI0033951F01
MRSGQNLIKRYYRVRAGDTAVTTISLLTLPPYRASCSTDAYKLLAEDDRFVDFPDLVTALEKAKAGALAYINLLIREGEVALPELLKYRIDHYEDLNINLLEANIRQVEQQLLGDPQFKWRPYRIQIPYKNDL